MDRVKRLMSKNYVAEPGTKYRIDRKSMKPRELKSTIAQPGKHINLKGKIR